MTEVVKSRVSRSPDNFAALRLFAAVLVVYGHSFPLTDTVAPGFLGNAVQTIAVKIFFVISGYLITESWVRDPHIFRYLQRRCLRIFPGLIVLIVLTVFLVGPLASRLSVADYFGHATTWQYFNNIILKPVYGLPGVFENNIYPGAVNGSLWTLPVEFGMYLVLPLILLIPMQKYSVAAFLVLSCALSIWYTRLYIPEAPRVIHGTSVVAAMEMAPFFLWGTFFRLWVPRKFFNIQVAVVVMFVAPFFVRDWATAEAVTFVVLPYAVLAFGFSPSPVFGFVEKLGDVSYGTYLYGFMVQQIISATLGTNGQPLLNFFVSAGITLVLGYLSWHLIESQALKLKPKTKRAV